MARPFETPRSKPPPDARTPRLPSAYASGEVNRFGRITKRGDGTVRTLLYEAANVLLAKISRT